MKTRAELLAMVDPADAEACATLTTVELQALHAYQLGPYKPAAQRAVTETSGETEIHYGHMFIRPQ